MDKQLEKLEYTKRHKERVQDIIDFINIENYTIYDDFENDSISLVYQINSKTITLSIPLLSEIFCYIDNEYGNMVYSYIPCHNEANFLKSLFDSQSK